VLAESGPGGDVRDLARVLVVEDPPPLRELLARVCAYEGWKGGTAEAGEPGIRSAVEWRPDVVLLDMMLPDIDGLEVLRRLRAALPRTAVVVVSARDSAHDRAVARDAGAAGYVTKPFGVAELTAEVRRLLAVPVPLPAAGC
jgi:two-component system, OmpR family, response regulator